MPIDLSQVNWVMWGVILVAVAVGWTILRMVLRMTMRVFSLGCIGLVILVAIIWYATSLPH
jgi:high-affinity Fe2+/Pb2+ permease